ncbi:MAG: RNA polymerase sigma factor [Myxococcota bacterium]
MDPAADTDLQLVQRWAQGDADAGGRFAQRHFSTLWTYFRNKVPGEPDDLIQATLLQCQRHGNHLAAAHNVRAYLLSIARSQLRDYYRRHHPSQDLELVSMRDLGSTVGTRLDRQRQANAIARALQGLSLAYQEVVELHYWSELSVAEIAEVVQVPVGTVKSRLIRARAALKALLQESEVADLDASLRTARESLASPVT